MYQKKITKKIDNLIKKEKDIKISKMLETLLKDYTLTNDDQLDEAMAEVADGMVDIYNIDLLKWIEKENADAIELIEDILNEGSQENVDFYQILREAQFMFYYNKIFLIFNI